MSNKIMKFIPLVLIISVIVDALPLFMKSIDYTTSTWMVTISTMALAAITSFIIFYADLKRNDSTISVFGMVAVGILVVLTISTLILAKTMNSMSDFNVANILSKLTTTATAVVAALRYISITNLISLENNSSTTNIFKTGAVISAGLIGLFGIITAWSTTTNITIINLATVTQNVFKVMIYSFILMQVIEAEEMLNRKVVEVQQQPQPTSQEQIQPQQAPENNIFSSSTPRFRNPALEAQEARIKEQQMQQTNNTPATPSFQIVNNNQPLINNNNPPQNQNNMNGNIQ